jgi:hypothetical protein
MNDILEFIDDLKELQELYAQGDLREFDFNLKIQKYEREVARFESAMFAEQLFCDNDFAYNYSKEV